MSLSQKDLEVLHSNKIDKIKTHINENWDKPAKSYEAYRYLIDNAFDDIRKDFLTGVTYYRDIHGEQVSLKNDFDLIESVAVICGLKKSDVKAHLGHRVKLLRSSWLIDVLKWDGVDRLKTICYSATLSNTSPDCFYEHVLAWGAGVFARANDSYFQNHALILRGNQGIGKDFFIKTICKAFGPYMSNWTNTKDEREIAMMMERALVLNIPEFDNTHKNDVAMLKAIITKADASYRKPYAHDTKTTKLRTSFISSANVEYLLRDSTGNRRYLIFVIEKFGLMDKFDEFDSVQILAQFKHAYDTGFKVNNQHRASMNSYIESQTPEPFENQVIESWIVEFDFALAAKGYVGTDDGWLRASRLVSAFEKIRKEFNIGRNHLSLILQNRGLKEKRKDGTYYTTPKTLRVLKSITE